MSNMSEAFARDLATDYGRLREENHRLRTALKQMERALRVMQPECNCGAPDGRCSGTCDKGLQMNALQAAESTKEGGN
jgi:hypothetical protein